MKGSSHFKCLNAFSTRWAIPLSKARFMNSNDYHFEIQVAKATNGQKNDSAEESTSTL